MFREKIFKRIFAAFFGSVYLFMALFSQNFHHHSSAEVFKDFHFKKTEKTYSTDTTAEAFTECLSCHILHTGYSLIPQEFEVSFSKTDDSRNVISIWEQQLVKCDISSFYLRGPPAIFI